MSKQAPNHDSEAEFLWLVSLSDLMILLFVFFVVLFSFSAKNMNAADYEKVSRVLKGETPPKTPLDEVTENLVNSLDEKGLLEDVEIIKTDRDLTLQIKEKVLFDSAKYHLKNESVEVLGLVSKAIENVPAPYRLGIEGHTDDVPIRSHEIEDNWALSLLRARSVFKSLGLSKELAQRTVIMGYGEMNPLVPNRDEQGSAIPENQSRNRRVTLRIF